MGSNSDRRHSVRVANSSHGSSQMKMTLHSISKNENIWMSYLAVKMRKQSKFRFGQKNWLTFGFRLTRNRAKSQSLVCISSFLWLKKASSHT